MKKILLVDDLGIDLMLTRMALEGYGAGYRIVVARDGEEAQRLIEGEGFDLLLVDIKMPRVDGFELLERLRAEGGERVPAIILSGSGLAADRARAQAVGAIDYIQKPVDYSVFKEELKATLERHGLN
jgi:two-component system, OmpR family, alkaline phosphatase synthesis response regulator PhoP